MKLVCLGTSGAMPTIERGLSSIVLVLDHEYIMVDCGDGTCRQYLKSNLRWNKPLTILITHMHSDHTMGILGLLQSMDLMGRTEPVKVFGVAGIKQFVLDVHRGAKTKFAFDFEVIEISDITEIKKKDFIITACSSYHQIPSLAYKITLPPKTGTLDIEKCIKLGVPENSPALGKLKGGEDVIINCEGKTTIIKSKDVVGESHKGLVIAFSGDTRPTSGLQKFYDGADYLIHEATFLEDEKELALKTKHSTAKEAGIIASLASVRKVILNHFSARHASTQPIYEEAHKMHPDVTIAKDLLELELN